MATNIQYPGGTIASPADLQNIRSGLGVIGNKNIMSSQLNVISGEYGICYEISDGPNRGAKIVWAIPNGHSLPTWCWWLWPQSIYGE